MKTILSGNSDAIRIRAAFTLVETLLALGLAGILLVGIFAAMDQTWKITASGREEMEQAQLARALISKIEVDIRAITFVPPPPIEEEATTTTTTNTPAMSATTTTTTSGGSGGSGGSSGGGSGSGGSSKSGGGGSGGSSKSGGGGSTGGGRSGGGGGGGGTSGAGTTGAGGAASTTSGSTAAPEEEPPPPNSKSIGLRGTSQLLEISISRPRRDLLPGTGVMSGMAGTSDLREVTYGFANPGTAGGAGFIRTEGDRMAVEMVQASGGSVAQVSTMQVLAPEVISVAFRYFDGLTWWGTWDSDLTGRIPRAVEITMQLAPPRRQPGLFNVATSRSMELFQTVITIPVSDPFPKEFVQ